MVMVTSTLDTSHFEMSALNALAPQNVPVAVRVRVQVRVRVTVRVRVRVTVSVTVMVRVPGNRSTC